MCRIMYISNLGVKVFNNAPQRRAFLTAIKKLTSISLILADARGALFLRKLSNFDHSPPAASGRPETTVLAAKRRLECVHLGALGTFFDPESDAV